MPTKEQSKKAKAIVYQCMDVYEEISEKIEKAEVQLNLLRGLRDTVVKINETASSEFAALVGKSSTSTVSLDDLEQQLKHIQSQMKEAGQLPEVTDDPKGKGNLHSRPDSNMEQPETRSNANASLPLGPAQKRQKLFDIKKYIGEHGSATTMPFLGPNDHFIPHQQNLEGGKEIQEKETKKPEAEMAHRDPSVCSDDTGKREIMDAARSLVYNINQQPSEMSSPMAGDQTGINFGDALTPVPKPALTPVTKPIHGASVVAATTPSAVAKIGENLADAQSLAANSFVGNTGEGTPAGSAGMTALAAAFSHLPQHVVRAVLEAEARSRTAPTSTSVVAEVGGNLADAMSPLANSFVGDTGERALAFADVGGNLVDAPSPLANFNSDVGDTGERAGGEGAAHASTLAFADVGGNLADALSPLANSNSPIGDTAESAGGTVESAGGEGAAHVALDPIQHPRSIAEQAALQRADPSQVTTDPAVIVHLNMDRTHDNLYFVAYAMRGTDVVTVQLVQAQPNDDWMPDEAVSKDVKTGLGEWYCTVLAPYWKDMNKPTEECLWRYQIHHYNKGKFSDGFYSLDDPLIRGADRKGTIDWSEAVDLRKWPIGSCLFGPFDWSNRANFAIGRETWKRALPNILAAKTTHGYLFWNGFSDELLQEVGLKKDEIKDAQQRKPSNPAADTIPVLYVARALENALEVQRYVRCKNKEKSKDVPYCWAISDVSDDASVASSKRKPRAGAWMDKELSAMKVADNKLRQQKK